MFLKTLTAFAALVFAVWLGFLGLDVAIDSIRGLPIGARLGT